MRDALRAGIRHQLGHGIQRHQLAAVRFEIDHVQPVGMLLILRQHLEQDAVLVGGRVDGGRELRAECVVEHAGDVVPVQTQRRGTVAIENHIDARVLDLQIAGHLLQARQPADDALQLGGFGVKLLGVRPIEREVVTALGHAPAHADGLGNRDEYAQSRKARESRPQPVHDIGDGGHALAARLEVDHEAAGIGGSAEAPTGTGVETLHVRVLDDHLRDQLLVLHHLVEGGALGGLGLDVEVVVVGVGNEALGHRDVEVSGGPQHRQEHGQHDGAVSQYPAESDAVETQHALKHPLQGAIEQAVAGGFHFPQEAAAQHGSEADRHHAGNQDGGADGHRELAEQAAQNARHEEDGNEDRGQRERHRDNREADFPGTRQRRRAWRFAMLDVADNVLQHDDGVVHHEAYGEDERHHGDVVDAEIQQVHHRERAHDGEGQGHGGNHGGPEVSQEQEDHHDDQRQGGGHGELDVLESLANILGAVAANPQVYGGRHLRLESRQQPLDVVDDLDGVAAGLAHHLQVHTARALRPVLAAVDLRKVLVVLHAVDHLRHVAQPDRGAIPVGDDHGPVFPCPHKLAVDLDIVGGMRAVQRARRNIDIPIAEGGIDLIEADLARGQLVGVHPHPDGVLGGAEHLHLGHAIHHGYALRHHGLGVFVEVGEAHGGGRQEQADDGLVAGVYLAERGRRGHPRRQQRHGLGDGRLDIHRGPVDIAAQVELQSDAAIALAAAGDHGIQAGDGGELALQGSGHGGSHGVGVGSRKAGRNGDGGVVHLRQVAHRQSSKRDDAEHGDTRHDEAGRNWPANEVFGNVHAEPFSSAVRRPCQGKLARAPPSRCTKIGRTSDARH